MKPIPILEIFQTQPIIKFDEQEFPFTKEDWVSNFATTSFTLGTSYKNTVLVRYNSFLYFGDYTQCKDSVRVFVFEIRAQTTEEYEMSAWKILEKYIDEWKLLIVNKGNSQ